MSELLTEVLRSAGCSVIPVSDGREAVRRLGEGGIDVVVTDLCMPQMDGIQLMTHLRSANRKVPVIAMSGALSGHTDKMLHTVRLMGARFTFQKPFSPLLLVEAVHRVVGREPDRRDGAEVGC